MNPKSSPQAADGAVTVPGVDLDLSRFKDVAPVHEPLERLTQLSPEDIAVMLRSGIDPDEGGVGSFCRWTTRFCIAVWIRPGWVSAHGQALEKYDGLDQFWWRAVAPDQDAYTARVDRCFHNGYFIRAEPGAIVTYPLQACLYLSEDKLAQDIHNVVVAEAGSHLHVLTGCATAARAVIIHVSISEFYQGGAMSLP